MTVKKKQILVKKLKRIIIFVVFLPFCHSKVLAQELPVAYIPPFEAPANETVLAAKVHALFRSQLSATSRLSFFSEEAWKGIIKTLRIQLTLDQLRQTQTAIEIGKNSSVSYIALGQITRTASRQVIVTIEWINLSSGLIEKTISFNADDDVQLMQGLSGAVQEISKVVVKAGKVAGMVSNRSIAIEKPALSGWQKGDEFIVINDLNYAYGRVRLNKLTGDSAFAEVIYLNDHVRVGDRVILHEHFTRKEESRPKLVLQPIKGMINELKKQSLFNKSRQIIIETAKVELLENIADSPYHEAQVNIYATPYDGLYMLNVLIKSHPYRRIIYENNLECLESDLTDGLSILLNLALQRWEQQAVVTRVDDDGFTINAGYQQNIRKGLSFIIKEPGSTEMISRGTITDVFAHHAYGEVPSSRVVVRAGCYAVFSPSLTDQQLLQQAMQNIKQRSDDFKHQAQKKRDQEERKKIALEKQKVAKTLPNSRLRFGYGHPVYHSKEEQRLFDWEKSPQMHLDWYLGKHPYFHWMIGYLYSHNELKDQQGFLFAHTGTGGARLTFPLFSKLVGYGKVLLQYNLYQSSSKARETSRFTQNGWQNYYMSVHVGLDLVLEPGISIYLEAGQRRKIETTVIDMEYGSIALGIAIWH